MKLTIAQSFSTALCAGTISMTELKNFGSSSRSQESALKLIRSRNAIKRRPRLDFKPIKHSGVLFGPFYSSCWNQVCIHQKNDILIYNLWSNHITLGQFLVFMLLCIFPEADSDPTFELGGTKFSGVKALVDRKNDADKLGSQATAESKYGQVQHSCMFNRWTALPLSLMF